MLAIPVYQRSSVYSLEVPLITRIARQAARNAVSLRRSTVGALPYSPDERLRRTSASLQVASACLALCSELQTSACILQTWTSRASVYS